LCQVYCEGALNRVSSIKMVSEVYEI